MGKISIQELASVLAENSSLNKKESSSFVSAMFDIIQEALERDRNVKIKGLGTFKIIDVEDRESVNVNTGERVLIEGHGKITFTPDQVMKELVNKPFSQFETVVLNDGVEFGETTEDVAGFTAILPDLDAKSEPELEPELEPESKPEIESESETDVELEPEPEPEQEPEVEPSAMPLVDFGQSDDELEESDEDIPEWVIEPTPKTVAESPLEEIADEDIPEWVIEPMPLVETPAEEKPAEKPAEESVKEEPVEEEATEEPVEENNIEDEPTTEEPVEDELVEDDLAEEEDWEEGSSSSKKWIWTALLALLLGLGGGYVLGNYFPFSTVQSYFASKSTEVKEVPLPVVKESPKVVDQPEVEQLETKQPQSEVEQKADQVPTVPEAKPAESTADEDIHAKYAAKDARVRTGAYRIVGTKKIVKAKEGETLLKISNRNLGTGVECYVEVYNDIKASTPLKEGQEIKIPELVLKKKKKTE